MEVRNSSHCAGAQRFRISAFGGASFAEAGHQRGGWGAVAFRRRLNRRRSACRALMIPVPWDRRAALCSSSRGSCTLWPSARISPGMPAARRDRRASGLPSVAAARRQRRSRAPRDSILDALGACVIAAPQVHRPRAPGQRSCSPRQARERAGCARLPAKPGLSAGRRSGCPGF